MLQVSTLRLGGYSGGVPLFWRHIAANFPPSRVREFTAQPGMSFLPSFGLGVVYPDAGDPNKGHRDPNKGQHDHAARGGTAVEEDPSAAARYRWPAWGGGNTREPDAAAVWHALCDPPQALVAGARAGAPSSAIAGPAMLYDPRPLPRPLSRVCAVSTAADLHLYVAAGMCTRACATRLMH